MRASPLQQEFTDATEPVLPSLRRRAYESCGNLEDAEDRVQEALAKAWKYWGCRRSAGVVKWLTKILDRCLLDHHKLESRLRRPPQASAVDLRGDEALRGAFTGDAMAAVLSDLVTDAMLSELSYLDRMCVTLVCIRGMSVRAASLEMAVPARTVGTAVERGKKTLMKFYVNE